MTGSSAKKFAKCFSKGVVKVVKGEDGESRAEIVDPRRDTCSREVLRHEVCVWVWVREGDVCVVIVLWGCSQNHCQLVV